VGEGQGTLDQVLELADVARPVVALQHLHCVDEIWRVGISICRLYLPRKKSTRSGMSSRRWRRGGRWMGMTLMR